MPKVEAPKVEAPKPAAPKAKPEVTHPPEGADVGHAAAKEIDVYSPRAYGSRTAPKPATKTSPKN